MFNDITVMKLYILELLKSVFNYLLYRVYDLASTTFIINLKRYLLIFLTKINKYLINIKI